MTEFTAPPFANEGEPMTTMEEVEVVDGKKRSNTPIDENKIKIVLQNIKSKTYDEIGEITGLTKNQVNRIVQTLKTGMREKALAQDPNAYEIKVTKTGKERPDYSKPLTEYAKKVENVIATKLSRPRAESSGGGGGRTQQALDAALNDLLESL